jgi:threonine dehydrogenase-like Zn-dependent dehydrogenase
MVAKRFVMAGMRSFIERIPMRAVLLPGDRRAEVVERARPDPRSHEVLVQTKASAICRSDMSIYAGDPLVGAAHSGDALIVPGHEGAGLVVAVGSAVRNVRVGDRVAAYLPVTDGASEFAASGHLMLDPDWKCMGFDFDGADAEYFTIPERNCLPLPDSLSFEAGAVMTDMVGTQYSTQKRINVTARDTVAVFGMGPMGGAAVLVARALGATVIAVDILESRLEQATKLGATYVVDSSKVDAVVGIRAVIPRGVDVAIDCSGNPAAQNAALDAAAGLGRVAFVGESRATEIRPSEQILRKLLTVVGGWYFALPEWNEIVRFVVEHRIPVEALISHRFSIEDAPEAFAAFDRRETEKAVFVWA